MNIASQTGRIPLVKRVRVLNYGLVKSDRDLNGKIEMVVGVNSDIEDISIILKQVFFN